MSQSKPKASFRLPHAFSIGEAYSSDSARHDLIIGATAGLRDDRRLWLGRVAEYQKMDVNCWIDLDAAHAIYVVGKRRSGKTFTLGATVEGILGIDGYSSGAPNQAVVVLDTMNVFLASGTAAFDFDKELLTKWSLGKPDSIPITLYYPAGSPPPPKIVNARPFSVPAHRFSLEDWADLFDLDPFASPMAQVLGSALQLVSEEGFTVDGVRIAPSLYDLETVANCVENAAELVRFDESTRMALGRRFRALSHTGLFSGSDSLFLEQGRASIFLLRDIEPELRRLLVNYLTTQILRGRADTESCERLLPTIADESERKALQERILLGVPRTWLIIDEAHNYVPAVGGGRCRKTINRYVTEGRNLGLSIVVASQHPSALDPALKRNADIVLIHTLSMREDIDVAANMLTTAVPSSITFDTRDLAKNTLFADATRSLPSGYCFVSSDTINRIVPVCVRPRVTYHGGGSY